MKIYAANIETLKTMQEEIWSEWIHLLDCTRRERIVELRQRKDQIQRIGAGLLLRYSFLKEGYTTEQWGRARQTGCDFPGKTKKKGTHKDAFFALSPSNY
mgnify:CR=1 FL=1